MAKTGVSFRHITIVGVGLLGGSAGLALKRAWPGATVAGVGLPQANLDQALKMGAIDAAYSDVAEPAGQSDLIILATPVCSFAQYLAAIAAGAAARRAGDGCRLDQGRRRPPG